MGDELPHSPSFGVYSPEDFIQDQIFGLRVVHPPLVERPKGCVSLNNLTHLVFEDVFGMELFRFKFLMQLPEATFMPANILDLDLTFSVLGEFRPVFADWLPEIDQAPISLNSHQDVPHRLPRAPKVDRGVSVELFTFVRIKVHKDLFANVHA